MRFDARLPDGETPPNIGDRVTIPPARLVSEWDLSTGGGKSLVPRRLFAEEPRDGIVRAVRPRAGLIVLDDVAPTVAPVSAILTVMWGGDRMLCTLDELQQLLRFLAARPVHTEQIPRVVDAVAPWIRRKFPELADISRCPVYETEAEYLAWVDGVTAVVGESRLVPVLSPPVDPGPTLFDLIVRHGDTDG